MKKQYNTTQLTDELKHSVFFQQPEAVEEPNERNQSTLAPHHQTTKETQQESTKAPSNQSTNEQSNQPAQETKHQSAVARKHFSSYLEPGTYKAWKLLATQREKRDYEILQEAMEQYLAREQEHDPNTR